MPCIICGGYVPEGEGHVCVNCSDNLDKKLAEFREAEKRMNGVKNITVRPVITCKHCLWYEEDRHFCTAGHIDGKIFDMSEDYCSRAILK